MQSFRHVESPRGKLATKTKTKVVRKSPATAPAAAGGGPSNVPHGQVLDMLKAGNKRFLDGTTQIKLKDSLAKLKEQAAKGQKPHTIILSCADSRVPVEMLFDMDVGEIFVIRVAGNIIAPEFVGSIEYAVASFGTQLIVVMGHTKCGAVKATIDNIGSAAGVPTEGIHEIVTRIKPNIFQTCQDCGLSDNDLVTRCVEVNTLSQCEALVGASRLIEKTVAGGSLKIVGSVFDLDSGEVYFCEKDEGEMEVIDSPGR